MDPFYTWKGIKFVHNYVKPEFAFQLLFFFAKLQDLLFLQAKRLKQIWGQYLTSGSIHPAFSLQKKSISAVIYAILCSCSLELQQRNTLHP